MRSAFLTVPLFLLHCSVYDEGLLDQRTGTDPPTNGAAGTSLTGSTGQPPDATSASGTAGAGLDTTSSGDTSGSNGTGGSGDGGASGATGGSAGVTGTGGSATGGPDDAGGKAGSAPADASATDASATDARVQHSVGGGCDSDLDCISSLKCDLSFPRGMCTATCDKNADCFGNICYMRKCYKNCAADPTVCRANYVCRTSGSDRYCGP